jgi:hypothetical protein
MYVIYKLIDPRDKIPFYVGYTKDQEKRKSKETPKIFVIASNSMSVTARCPFSILEIEPLHVYTASNSSFSDNCF